MFINILVLCFTMLAFCLWVYHLCTIYLWVLAIFNGQPTYSELWFIMYYTYGGISTFDNENNEKKQFLVAQKDSKPNEIFRYW